MQIERFIRLLDERNSEKFSLMRLHAQSHSFHFHFLAGVISASKQTCKGDKQQRNKKRTKLIIKIVQVTMRQIARWIFCTKIRKRAKRTDREITKLRKITFIISRWMSVFVESRRILMTLGVDLDLISFTVDFRHRRLFSSCMTRIIHTSYETFATVNEHTCYSMCSARCDACCCAHHQLKRPMFFQLRWFGVNLKRTKSNALN